MNRLLLNDLKQKLEGVSQTPYLDALFFLEHFEPNEPDETQIQDFLMRRALNEPVSKIIGKKGFWKLDFFVSTDVLDPRPDSECLIESVLKYFKDKSKPYQILDIGTGSGCLLLCLLYEYQNACGLGVDISQKALDVAQKNAKGFNASFLKKDFYQDDFILGLAQYDIIVSNPPYIKTSDIPLLEDSVKKYDPMLALDGGEDGLNPYRFLALSLKKILSKEGMIFFEIGQGQETDVKTIMSEQGYTFVEEVKDLSGIIRVLIFKNAIKPL